MIQEIYINIITKDLTKAKQFFTHVGFSFNPMFTNDVAACMIIDKDKYVMILTENHFKQFTQKNIVDSKENTEVIVFLSVESRTKVDEIIKKVSEAGGHEYGVMQDHGWYYSRSFEDLDHHLWEIGHMDTAKIPDEMKKEMNT